MSGTRIVVVGDAFLDRDVHGDATRLAPEAPVPVLEEREVTERPGGAGLAALLLARAGRPVTLVTALGSDRAGAAVRDGLREAGVEVLDLGLAGPTAEKIRLLHDGRPVTRLDRGGAPSPPGPPTPAARSAISWADAVLVADYGRGVTVQGWLRDALEALADRIPIVWDPHPRGPAPVAGTRLATPNAAELGRLVPGALDGGLPELIAGAEALGAHWETGDVCVTRGRLGALLVGGRATPLLVPAPRAEAGDPCGAGDRFAGATAAALADGASPQEAVELAVDVASAFVAAGGASRLGAGDASRPAPGPERWDLGSAVRLAHRVRADGGTVVATGGCFDLLHAGHLALLEAARGLGDLLVVLLNADATVRRLKGPGRPVVPEHDRARVLAGLACVDAVALFSEPTPAGALAELRPHIWAKGGDYGGQPLPEADAVLGAGGSVVLVPTLDGRSTTSLVDRVTRAGTPATG